MFCFSDHTWMHLHPTGLGPMGAAANGRYGAWADVAAAAAEGPERCRKGKFKPRHHRVPGTFLGDLGARTL